uniref:TOG domain-containing protein n=1 Tax=Arcella intermedia TaxID=1963864 RepID=A0A6B2KWD2_9EUKA
MDRAVHHHWRVKSEAYEELEKKCLEALDGNAKIFYAVAEVAKKVVEDKNVVSRERGLAMLTVWFDRFDHSKKYSLVVANSLIDCISGSRQKTKELAENLLLLFMEIDILDPYILLLIEGASSKVPKTTCACISVIKQALTTFGIRVFPLKPVLSALIPGWFEHSNAGVRNLAAELALELYRWLGEAMKKNIETLREAQVSSLNKTFSELPNQKPTPLKRLRSQTEEPEPLNQPTPTNPTQPDPYAAAPPTDILPQIPDSFYTNLLSKKWQERKEQTEWLLGLLDVPRIRPADFSALIQALKKALHDCNVRVVEDAVRCLGLLGRGLRRDFAGACRAQGLVMALLEKFQEKKPPVVLALHEALGWWHPHAFGLGDIGGEIGELAKSKVPSVKVQVLVFLEKVVLETPKAVLMKVYKTLCADLLVFMDDSDVKVRDNSYVVFAKVVMSIGERTVQGFTNKLDPIKQAKIKELIPQTSQNPPDNTQAPSLDPPTSKPALPEEKPVLKAEKPPPVKTERPSDKLDKEIVKVEKNGRTERPQALRVPVEPVVKAKNQEVPADSNKRKAGRAPPTTVQNQTKRPKIENEEPNKLTRVQGKVNGTQGQPGGDEGKGSGFLFTAPEVNSKALSIIDGSTLELLKDSSSWKTRLEGLVLLSDEVECMGADLLSERAETIVGLLQHHPGFSESISQIVEKLHKVLHYMFVTLKQISPEVASVVVEGLSDKIFVPKCKNIIYEIYTEIGEKISYSFLFSVIFRVTPQSKSSKSSAELIDFLTLTTAKIGADQLDKPQMLAFCKQMLENSNSGVRKSLFGLLGEVQKHFGVAAVKNYFADIKPALLLLVMKELEKGEGKVVEVPAPKRSNEVRDSITPKAIESLSSLDWTVRQNSINEISNNLNTTKQLPSTKITMDLLLALRDRLQDSNKKIFLNVLQLFQAISKMPGIEPYLRVFLPALLKSISDPQASVKVIATLDNLCESVGMDALCSYFVEALSGTTAKKELLNWILLHLPNDLKNKFELKGFIKPALNCLNDKSHEIKKLGEQLMNIIAKFCDKREIESQSSTFPTSVSNQVSTILSKIQNPKELTRKNTDKNLLVVKQVKKVEEMESTNTCVDIVCKDVSCPKIARALNNNWPRSSISNTNVDNLKEQMKCCFNATLITKLFSSDIKKWSLCFDEMKMLFTSHNDIMIENLDLILKWLTWRLCDPSNPVDKMLSFVVEVFNLLINVKYQLTDYEMDSFLPIFMEKLSSTSSKTRLVVSESLKLLFKLHPPANLIQKLMAIFPSDTPGLRLLIITELKSLVISYTPSILKLETDLPLIVRYLHDQDELVPPAVLSFCHTVYAVLKERFWDYLPELNSTQRFMIQMKIQDLVSQSQVSNFPSKIPTFASTPMSTPLPPSFPSIGQSTPAFPMFTSTFIPPPSQDVSSSNQFLSQRSMIPPQTPFSSFAPSPFTIFGAPLIQKTPSTPKFSHPGPQNTFTSTFLEEIEKWRIALSSESKTNFCTYEPMQQYLKDTDASLIKPHINSLVSMLIDALNSHLNQQSPLAPFAIGTIIFVVETFSKEFQYQTISSICKMVFGWLSNDKLMTIHDGIKLKQSLNYLIMRVFTYCNQTLCLTVLLNELSVSLPPFFEEQKEVIYSRYTGFVLKCLDHFMKQMGKYVSNLKYREVFKGMNELFLSHPKAVEWIGKHPKNPLNIVFSLLQEIAKHIGKDFLVILKESVTDASKFPLLGFGEGIYFELYPDQKKEIKEDKSVKEVKTVENPVQKEVKVNGLETSEKKLREKEVNEEKKEVDEKKENEKKLISQSPYLNMSTFSSEELKQILVTSLKKISKKDDQAVADLFVLMSYPQLQIPKYIQHTSPQFQEHIKQLLKAYASIDVNQIRNSLVTPKPSLPVSLPPPKQSLPPTQISKEPIESQQAQQEPIETDMVLCTPNLKKCNSKLEETPSILKSTSMNLPTTQTKSQPLAPLSPNVDISSGMLLDVETRLRRIKSQVSNLQTRTVSNATMTENIQPSEMAPEESITLVESKLSQWRQQYPQLFKS